MGFMKGNKKKRAAQVENAPYIHAGNAAAFAAAQVENAPRGGFFSRGYSSLNLRSKHPAELSTAADHGMRYGTETVGTFFLLLVGT